MATRKKPVPTETAQPKELPSTEVAEKKLPSSKMKKLDIPNVGNPENTVMIGGKPIEIKPTKLKYQRNRTAVSYKLLEFYPLADLVAMSEENFEDGRDGDKMVMDWLIAVTDDEELIRENYDEMDTGTIEKMLAIFKRVNKIDEKEAKQKNLSTERMKD